MEEKNEIGIHWRVTSRAIHCGVEILPDGKDIEYIVIEKFVLEKDVMIGGRIEEKKYIAYFAPNPYTKLPMVINPTNAKVLTKLFKEPRLNLLKNIAVRLTQEDTKYGFGLRISKLPPTIPQVLNPSHPNWDKCVTFVKGGGNIEEMKSKYVISEEVEKLLRDGK